MSAPIDYYSLGVMSGSSLDGLDLARVHFRKLSGGWRYQLCETETIPFPPALEKILKTIAAADRQQLTAADQVLGKFIGISIQAFIRKHRIRRVDVIGSHGHTVRHHPEQRDTLQIGNAKEIARLCQRPVVWNLRKKDVLAGGQGAPIVPIADWHLFPQYAVLINLGGIANVSIKATDRITAWDICPFNQVFNHYARLCGKAYDRGGKLAGSGRVHQQAMDAVMRLPYFSQLPPKSLDNQYTRKVITGLDRYSLSPADASATWVRAAARLIAQEIPKDSAVYVTGGGAFHRTAIQALRQEHSGKVIVADKQMIQSKEALAMAFIAVLRLRGEVNVLSSVTGARRDTVCGDIVRPAQSKKVAK